jgi:amidase
MSDPMLLSATALSKAIHAREVSCLEVMAACLARVERLNPKVNAIVSLADPESLLREAGVRDAQLARGESMGWMHGFPQAPKDLTAVAGMPTSSGSPFLKGTVAASDSVMASRMRAAGSIFIGRTNVPEFGLGSHTYNTVFGTTGNAWNPAKTAGGSSGGAAVALALDMLPVADGSDMMGSLRNPAGWNNVYGMRPSLGRVPYGPGADLFFQQLGTEGPMARNADDMAHLMAVQAGYDPRTPLAQGEAPGAFAVPAQRDFKGARVAWMGDYNGYLATEPEVMDLCGASLEYFADIGCSVDAAQPDFDMARLWECWLTLRAFLVAGNLRPHYENPARRARLKPEAAWEVERGMALPASTVFEASAARSAWYTALLRLFESYEFLVLPSAQVFPFDAAVHWPATVGGRAMDTYHRWMEVVIGATLAGLPAASVPAGFSADGLPLGLQIIGRPRADAAVLQLAMAWQRATPFGARRAALAG